jgi:hypothetical protein
VAISSFKKEERETCHLKNRLPRLNATGVQARNDKNDEVAIAPRMTAKGLSLRSFLKESRDNLSFRPDSVIASPSA